MLTLTINGSQNLIQSKIATARNVGSTADVDATHLSLGLFAYPVLQAADILLYK